MENIGLVLEGGGMRGLFTAGVLDFFLDQNIEFPYVVGVSAGACNAVSYISKQYQRNLRINTMYLKDKRYFSLRNLLTTGSLFGMEMLFQLIPNTLDPFDYDAFKAARCRMRIVTTDCVTGLAAYYDAVDLRDSLLPLQASMSLPVISAPVRYDGKLLMDGGVADPIPIQQSIADGNTKNVVVLTRDAAYRKTPEKYFSYIKRKYRDYPKLVEALKQRHTVYNEALALTGRLEREGKAVVIRPEQPLDVGRLERRRPRLEALYREGYRAAENKAAALERLFDNRGKM
jgi:predicted patatin/cPLA2 family phospholipase